ncbi:hypothetical protein CN553_23535 [Bacillus cereus]|uniref:Terminase ATPase subunit N-terminal domain-containing protein n=1 Tax=Bacillus cereus TaxID=1396 RepID=A0A9X6U829_BACCE|nr:helix-turn-helix domain-containing protein [Bacillus cereus]PEN88352.1 hypothetical protein CN553_23535 [Bacillus cereus]
MKTTKTRRVYERYQAIYFYVQGFSIKEIMNMIGRSKKTIYNYVNAYKDTGLNGLLMGQSQQENHVNQLLNKNRS